MVSAAQRATAEGARMSSVGAQAKATAATRKTHESYCRRPDAVAKNSPLPRYGWLVQHALYMSCAVVLKAMWSLKPTDLPNNRGVLLKSGSVTVIAERTGRFTPGSESGVGVPMPRRTVAHCLVTLQARGFICPWESRSKNSPFGASWRLPRYDEILQRWAEDTNIGTVGKRAFYAYGKSHRFLTPAEIVEWKLDNAAAERLPAAQASSVDIEEPLSAAEAKGATAGEEIDAVHAAVLGIIERGDGQHPIQGIDATPEQAMRILEIARAAVPAIPASAIAELVRQIRIDKTVQDSHSRKPAFTNVGWILKGMAAAAHSWRHQHSERAAG